MVRMFVTVTINNKGFDANIQTNNSICNREWYGLYFTKDAYIVFAACGTANCGFADSAFNVAAFTIAHLSKRRELNVFIVNFNILCAGSCVTFFSSFTLEIWKASSVLKEAFIGIIQLAAAIFKSLAIYFGEPW